MKRIVTGSLVVAAAACAGGPAADGRAPLPDWRGPAVHCRHLGDRGLEVELMAPTAGHELELAGVDVVGTCAEVQLVHRLPTADFVAQVLTTQRLVVPAERLADATVVMLWIASPTVDQGARRLAITTARP